MKASARCTMPATPEEVRYGAAICKLGDHGTREIKSRNGAPS